MGTGREMETLSDATRRLQDDGYVGNWYVNDDARLVHDESVEVYDATDITVDEVVRFEATSDPGDESILFALRTKDGHKGLYSVTYGPYTPPGDAAVVRALRLADR